MNSKISLMVIAIIGLMFLSMPANATETFNETFFFNSSGQNTETIGAVGAAVGVPGDATFNGDLRNVSINFDNNKILSKIILGNTYYDATGNPFTTTLVAGVNGVNTNYIGFNAYINNLLYGSGNIGWERTTGNNFNYVLYFTSINQTYANTLTGKHGLELIYNHAAYSCCITAANYGVDNGRAGANYNYVNGTTTIFSTNFGWQAQDTAGTAIATFSSNDYATLTFNTASSSFGYANLYKNSFNMRFNVTNSTNYSYSDRTSTTDESRLVSMSTGVIAYTEDIPSGIWANRTLVTASGVAVTPAPTPTPAPTAPPASSTTGAAISWNAASYNVNDIGTITGNVTVSPPLFGDIRVTVVNSSGQQAFYVWDSSGTFPQVESFLFSFPSADLYTANLISHSPFFGDTNLANATAQAVQPISYIFAPSTTTTGSNISISYKFNPTPTTGAIEDVTTDQFGIGGISTYINTTLCPCDTSTHSINYTINGVGRHTLRLWDTSKIKVVASTIVDVTSAGAIVPGNITSNQLFLDGTTYSVNDVINGQYQISSVNWSSYGYFKASLVSSGNISMGSVALDSQVGTFQIPVSGGAFNIFQSGAANVTIFAGTSVLSANNVMASVPVTILSSKNGYSISVNPVNICRTQTEYVKYTSPSGAGILQVMSMTPAGTTKFTNVSFTQNGTQMFVFNDGTVKDKSGIIFNVLDTNGAFQVNSIVKYQSTGCTAPGVTPTVTATPNVGVGGGGGDVINLLSSNLFWALIFIVGMMMFIAIQERKK